MLYITDVFKNTSVTFSASLFAGPMFGMLASATVGWASSEVIVKSPIISEILDHIKSSYRSNFSLLLRHEYRWRWPFSDHL